MYYRKVIKIRADDSPNVRYAQSEIAKGKEPSGKILIPGVKSYEEFVIDTNTLDEVMRCISLDAEFYKGADVLLFPPTWIDNSITIADGDSVKNIKGLNPKRRPTHMGIDPAEGGDRSSFALADRFGLIDLLSEKTPDTNVIYAETLKLMEKHKIKPEDVYFDRGGGGKQHADRLRASGYNVNTVGFGESVSLEKTRAMTSLETRKDVDEERYVYKNRRAEMHGILSISMDPTNANPFALPKELIDVSFKGRQSLRKQMALIPRLYDGEGRLKLPPKNKSNPNSKEKTLIEIIGHSPDELDAVVLATYGIFGRHTVNTVEIVF